MADKMSIAELAAAIKRREPRLGSVPDAELVRKVFERRPELMNFVQTSEPRRPIGSLYERVGGRLKENLNLPKQAEGAASAIHEGLRNIREHGPSKMPEFLNALKQYGKPENAIGDILTAVILGQGGGRSLGRLPHMMEADTPTLTLREQLKQSLDRLGGGKSAQNYSSDKVISNGVTYEYRGGQFFKNGKVLESGADIASAVDALEAQPHQNVIGGLVGLGKEPFSDMVTRRGPGEPPPAGPNLAQQRSLLDNLHMRYNQQKAAGDPGMWNTASKLREVEDAVRQAEKEQWGPAYSKSPQSTSSQGGGGANYSAEDLAEFKKKWGIK